MSDNFSVDDILAEYKKNVRETGSIDRKPSISATADATTEKSGTDSDLTLLSKDKEDTKTTDFSREKPEDSLTQMKAEIRERHIPKSDKAVSASKENFAQTQQTKASRNPLPEQMSTTTDNKTLPRQMTKTEETDDFKPTEPLFSMEQMRKIAADRKKAMVESINKPVQEVKMTSIPSKTEEKAPSGVTAILRETEEKAKKAEAIAKMLAENNGDSDVTAILKQTDENKAKKESKEEKSAPPPSKKSDIKKEAEKPHKAATIFGDIDDEKPKQEKATVSVNTGGTATIKERILQYRFLFEELTKRDFKKKYKRTFLGVLWSVISPFFTFLIQFFIFGSLFGRNDSNFVIYLLTGNLMFHFFQDATNAGMFSMYSNSAVLSKIKVPKTIFLLSSNVASVFNFFLTLLVYFIFMIVCGVSFGPHLLLMIYPILCLIIFNIGISYILSALFVFFRDIQYLYSIVTMLLMYMSAIFYYADSLPDNLQFVFAINPVYRYIAYMRQLVIDATIPSLTSHLLCLGFAVGALLIGYFFHKKTEKNFVYYY